METKPEYCVRHGHCEFFLAYTENGFGDDKALHCPECHPELFAELTAIDAALAGKQDAARAVADSTMLLIDAVRATVARGRASRHLKDSLRRYNEAVATLESL